MNIRVVASCVACTLLMVHAAGAQLAWVQVVGGSAVTPAGFGDSGNTNIWSAAVFGGNLYVGTVNTSTGAEVWRSSDGISWSQVNSDNFGQNVATHGNWNALSMAVFAGIPFDCLYVGTAGQDATGDAPARVWSSADGSSWTQANTDGFGDLDNSHTYSMAAFNGMFYAGVDNPAGAELWMRPDNLTTWFPANTNGFGTSANHSILSLVEAGSSLFASTYNPHEGVEVWSLASDIGAVWIQANPSGFGTASNFAGYAMETFNGSLYVGVANDNGFEIWRTQGIPGSSPAAPVTSWESVGSAGLGEAEQVFVTDMEVHNQALYLASSALGVVGNVWRSQNGAQWSKTASDAFGTATASPLEIPTLIEFNGMLYAGSQGPAGCQMWRLNGPFFADGFESGDLTLWSTSILPLPGRPLG